MNRKSALGIYSAVYALFYTFCLYKNMGGITFPFFTAGTLIFFGLCMKEFRLTLKKDSLFAAVCAMLISVSQVLTANDFIQCFNVIAVFALLAYILLHQFAKDEKWSFLQHFENLISAFFGGISNFFAPLKDYSFYRKNKNTENEKPGFPWHIVLITALCCLPVLLLVIMLLSSADAVFQNMLGDVFESLIPDGDWVMPVLLTVFVFFFIYAQISRLLKFPYSEEEKLITKGNSLIAMTVGVMFDFVYLIFSLIQILYLFIGKFTLPEGYTYAEYAREGFFQLLFVSFLNLLMVFAGIYFFEEKKSLKIILSVLSGCTYIMILSSAYRMVLYIRYFYFSFERILVLWALAVIFTLLTGLVIQTWKNGFKFFKYTVVVLCLFCTVLSFSKPDYFIAKWNLENSEEQQGGFFLAANSYNDYGYLIYGLSDDAASVLVKNENTCADYTEYRRMNTCELTFRSFNASRYKANKLTQ